MTVSQSRPTDRFNIEVNQGSSWSLKLLPVDSEDTVIDFSGCTARMKVRQTKTGSDELLSLTTDDHITIQAGDAGTTPPVPSVIIELSPAETAALGTPGSTSGWYYDLEIVYGALDDEDAPVWRPIEGKFEVFGEVTR